MSGDAAEKLLPAHNPCSMLDNRMRMDPSPRLSIRAASSFLLLALLGGCLPIGGVHSEDPDGTLSFNHAWQDVAPCAKDQLSATFAGAKMTMAPTMAEITVIGNYGGSTAMLVDIQDDGPGKSKAIVHAHDYMLVWGPATDRALKSLKKCQDLKPDIPPA
jgi:hypothetical protein